MEECLVLPRHLSRKIFSFAKLTLNCMQGSFFKSSALSGMLELVLSIVTFMQLGIVTLLPMTRQEKCATLVGLVIPTQVQLMVKAI